MKKKPPATDSDPHLNARQQAEALLAESGTDYEAIDERELKELVFELHVNHAELEIQNEELRGGQRELERERERYAELFESAPVGYFVLDSSGTVREVNLTAVEMLGVERRQVIGRQLSRFVSPNTRSRYFAHLRSLTQTGTREARDLDMIVSDGGTMTVRMESKPVRNDDADIGSFRITISDISGRKAAEADRDSAWTEIQRQKDENSHLLERFRLMAENTHSAIFICDRNRFRFVNTACEALTGQARAILLTTKPWRVLKPTERADAEHRLHEALDQERDGQSCEMTVLSADGRETPVEITINRVFDGGNPAVLGTAIDISEHKRLESELKERLDDRSRELTEVLRNLENDAAEAAASGNPQGSLLEETHVLNAQIDSLQTALNVVMNKRDNDLQTLENRILSNLRHTVIPELENLRQRTDNPEVHRCLNILEKELSGLASGFSCSLALNGYGLTATEIRVASLIRKGLTSDEISEHLNLATKTISFHRTNIRKKLGLKSRKDNLQTHLLSLNE